MSASGSFDPGPGWHEWTGETELVRPMLRLEYADGSTRYWIKETPVPALPLPTVPGVEEGP